MSTRNYDEGIIERWRVEPRLEGESRACGRSEFFTITP